MLIRGNSRSWNGLSESVTPFRTCHFAGSSAVFLLNLVGDGNNLHLAAVRPHKLHLVDHGVKAIVMRAQCLQHLPDHGVGLIVVQSLV